MSDANPDTLTSGIACEFQDWIDSDSRNTQIGKGKIDQTRTNSSSANQFAVLIVNMHPASSWNKPSFVRPNIGHLGSSNKEKMMAFWTVFVGFFSSIPSSTSPCEGPSYPPIQPATMLVQDALHAFSNLNYISRRCCKCSEVGCCLLVWEWFTVYIYIYIYIVTFSKKKYSNAIYCLHINHISTLAHSSLMNPWKCISHLTTLALADHTSSRHLEISSTKLSHHTTHTMTMMDTHPTSDLTTESLEASSTPRLTKQFTPWCLINPIWGATADDDLSDDNKQGTCGDHCF